MKIYKLLTMVTLMVMHTGYLCAQANEPCHTTYQNEQLNLSRPEMLDQRQEIEANIHDVLSYEPGFRVGQSVVTIPVVIHVLYNNAAENISTAQIMSQLDVLNRDFRRLNSDTVAIPGVWAPLMADAEIEFCLATIDPLGNPSIGITRTPTSVTTFSNSSNDMKFDSTGGKNAWPTDEYLNLWVCDMTGQTAFAQFPGFDPATDGIAIDYQRFGDISTSQQEGRLLVHEIGHWLNLLHIWGSSATTCTSDSVADTPLQLSWSTGCPVFPMIDVCTPGNPGVMFMNYMDYTDDICKNSFTNGQVARMHASLALYRPGILNSSKCNPLLLPPADASVESILKPSGVFCSLEFAPEFSLVNYGADPLNSVTINYQLDAEPVQMVNWTGNLISLMSETVVLPTMSPAGGNHILEIWTSAPNGSIDIVPGNDRKSSAFTNNAPPVGQSVPLIADFESGAFPMAGWSIENPDNSVTWDLYQGVSGFGNGQRCIRMNNFNYPSNFVVDILNLPTMDISNLPGDLMTFDIAYQLRNLIGRADTLKVQVSTDCGTSWANVYVNSGEDMTTTISSTSEIDFVPLASEWRKESIDLSPFSSSNSVMIRFWHKNLQENNLYIDNIQIGGLVGTTAAEVQSQEISLHPNPVKDRMVLTFSQTLALGARIRIINPSIGIVKTFEPRTYGSTSLELDVSDLAAGAYFLELQSSAGRVVKKFIKGK